MLLFALGLVFFVVIIGIWISNGCRGERRRHSSEGLMSNGSVSLPRAVRPKKEGRSEAQIERDENDYIRALRHYSSASFRRDMANALRVGSKQYIANDDIQCHS